MTEKIATVRSSYPLGEVGDTIRIGAAAESKHVVITAITSEYFDYDDDPYTATTDYEHSVRPATTDEVATLVAKLARVHVLNAALDRRSEAESALESATGSRVNSRPEGWVERCEISGTAARLAGRYAYYLDVYLFAGGMVLREKVNGDDDRYNGIMLNSPGIVETARAAARRRFSADGTPIALTDPGLVDAVEMEAEAADLRHAAALVEDYRYGTPID